MPLVEQAPSLPVGGTADLTPTRGMPTCPTLTQPTITTCFRFNPLLSVCSMPPKRPGSSVSKRGRKKARVDTTPVGHLSEPQPTYAEEDVGKPSSNRRSRPQCKVPHQLSWLRSQASWLGLAHTQSQAYWLGSVGIQTGVCAQPQAFWLGSGDTRRDWEPNAQLPSGGIPSHHLAAMPTNAKRRRRSQIPASYQVLPNCEETPGMVRHPQQDSIQDWPWH